MTNQEQDQQFLREAIRLGRRGMESNQGGPFGSLVVRDGRIVGKGFNRVTSSIDPTAHAEMEAIRDACKTLNDFQLEGCVIYASCEPCPMCLGAIYWARADRIVFAAGKETAAEAGFDDEFIYRELEVPPAERSIPTRQILANEGAQLFEEWKEKSDRLNY